MPGVLSSDHFCRTGVSLIWKIDTPPTRRRQALPFPIQRPASSLAGALRDTFHPLATCRIILRISAIQTGLTSCWLCSPKAWWWLKRDEGDALGARCCIAAPLPLPGHAGCLALTRAHPLCTSVFRQVAEMSCAGVFVRVYSCKAQCRCL